ncbi:MAG: hypothetical protein WCC64_14620 [Aliidongia sp.]
MLNARRREKDFLLHRDATYAAEHVRKIAVANAALDVLTSALIPSDPRRKQLDAVRQGISTYDQAFRLVVEDETKVGLTEESGLMGPLCGSVHKVEAILNAHDEARRCVLMLMMRRDEKDFLARKDPKYINELAKRGAEFAIALPMASLQHAA